MAIVGCSWAEKSWRECDLASGLGRKVALALARMRSGQGESGPKRCGARPPEPPKHPPRPQVLDGFPVWDLSPKKDKVIGLVASGVDATSASASEAGPSSAPSDPFPPIETRPPPRAARRMPTPLNPPRSDPFSFASTRHDVPWSEKSGATATSRGSTQAEDEKVDGKEEEEQVEIKEVRV